MVVLLTVEVSLELVIVELEVLVVLVTVELVISVVVFVVMVEHWVLLVREEVEVSMVLDAAEPVLLVFVTLELEDSVMLTATAILVAPCCVKCGSEQKQKLTLTKCSDFVASP